MSIKNKLNFGILAMLFISGTAIAQVGLGTATPDPSAALDVVSTTQGFLPPRLTTSERDAIVNPAIGLTIYNKEHQCLNVFIGYWKNTCAISNAGPDEVFNPITGLTWMDKNLGATQVATSSTDAASYGDLYQWGRAADGHEKRTSPTRQGFNVGFATTVVPNQGNPWDGEHITGSSATQNNWVTPQNDNLWQGVNGINNPCPSGYRVPTAAELDAERQTWNPMNPVGAFNSPLKWPLAGTRRGFGVGALANEGTGGIYWTSTSSATGSILLEFGNNNQQVTNVTRTTGASVRCIKDKTSPEALITSFISSPFNQPGTLSDNVPASGVQVWLQYRGGNGGYLSPISVNSTGVTGLTATLAGATNGTYVINPDNIYSGSGYLIFDITGTPMGSGTATFNISFGSQNFVYNKAVAP